MNKAYLAIDPGKSGAVCIITPETTLAYKCPKDTTQMSSIIRTYTSNCTIEQYEQIVGIEKVNVFPTDGKVVARNIRMLWHKTYIYKTYSLAEKFKGKI
mgnify:CR=1 FL=1